MVPSNTPYLKDIFQTILLFPALLREPIAAINSQSARIRIISDIEDNR